MSRRCSTRFAAPPSRISSSPTPTAGRGVRRRPAPGDMAKARTGLRARGVRRPAGTWTSAPTSCWPDGAMPMKPSPFGRRRCDARVITMGIRVARAATATMSSPGQHGVVARGLWAATFCRRCGGARRRTCPAMAARCATRSVSCRTSSAARGPRGFHPASPGNTVANIPTLVRAISASTRAWCRRRAVRCSPTSRTCRRAAWSRPTVRRSIEGIYRLSE